MHKLLPDNLKDEQQVKLTSQFYAKEKIILVNILDLRVTSHAAKCWGESWENHEIMTLNFGLRLKYMAWLCT